MTAGQVVAPFDLARLKPGAALRCPLESQVCKSLLYLAAFPIREVPLMSSGSRVP